jgi:hypothetical protein
MAKLTGDLGFTGSLGNISAFKPRNAKSFVLRTKGGPTAKQVKYDPAFENTRRNNDEFGGASTAAKALRDGLYPVKNMSGGSVGYINSFTRALANMDTVSTWGKRAVRFSETRQYLEGFNLNQNLLLSTILRQPVTGQLDRATGQANLQLPALVTGINFKVPGQYKLYRFKVLLTVIPDFEHSLPVEPYYQPVQPVTYPTECVSSDWYAAKENVDIQDFNLQLKNYTGLPDCHSLVLALAIEFGEPLSHRLVKTIEKTGAVQILACA